MHLETAQSIEHANVTEAQLREAFRDDTGRGDFINLIDDERSICASGIKDGPYCLICNESDDEFYAGNEYTKAQVEQAFVWYLQNDGRWRTDFPWKKEEKKPWWKLW